MSCKLQFIISPNAEIFFFSTVLQGYLYFVINHSVCGFAVIISKVYDFALGTVKLQLPFIRPLLYAAELLLLTKLPDHQTEVEITTRLYAECPRQ